MLYDSFLLKVQDGYLLDCDSRVVSDFIFHLKQYRLRSKLTIEDWSTRWAVVAEWNWAQEGGEHCGHPISDERCDWRMRRVFVPRERGEVVDHISDDPSIYNVLRMINGVPEGPAELVRNKAIPVEYNLDLMKGGGHLLGMMIIDAYSRSAQGMLPGTGACDPHHSSRRHPQTSTSH